MIRNSGFFTKLAVGCFATAAFCATPAAQAEPVTIEVWHYFTQEQTKPFNELINRFQQLNPDIKVTAVYQGVPPQLRQKLDGALATTPPTVPVISTVYENWTTDYVSKGYLEPVQTYLDGPDGLAPADLNDMVKVFRDACTYDGKLVSMPFNKSVYMLYLNMSLLNAQGVTTVPKTLAEYGDAIRKGTIFDNGRAKVFGVGIQPKSEALTTLLYANGGEFFDAAGKPTFDTPEALQVLTFLKDIQIPKKHAYVNTDYMSNPFGNQQISMYIYSSASFPYNTKLSKKKDGTAKFDYQAAAIPAGPSGKAARFLMQGTNLTIFKERPEAEKKAAWKFLKFLYETKNAVYWATKSGYMPIRYTMVKDADMQAYMASDTPYNIAANLVLKDAGRQEPRIPEWDGLRTELDAMVDRVINRGTDPAAELKETQARVEKKLAKK